MPKNILIVSKNMSWWTILCIKTGSLSTQWSTLWSISLPYSLEFNILKFCNLRRSNTTSWNNSVICRLLHSLANFVLSLNSLHNKTLGNPIAICRVTELTRGSLGFVFTTLSTCFVPFLKKIVSLLRSSIHTP